MVFFSCDGCGEALKKNQVRNISDFLPNFSFSSKHTSRIALIFISQVEKHSFRCRSDAYSCIDCQVIFTWVYSIFFSKNWIFYFSRITYAQHVKCITENQKYGGSGYVEKEAKVVFILFTVKKNPTLGVSLPNAVFYFRDF